MSCIHTRGDSTGLGACPCMSQCGSAHFFPSSQAVYRITIYVQGFALILCVGVEDFPVGDIQIYYQVNVVKATFLPFC